MAMEAGKFVVGHIPVAGYFLNLGIDQIKDGEISGGDAMDAAEFMLLEAADTVLETKFLHEEREKKNAAANTDMSPNTGLRDIFRSIHKLKQGYRSTPSSLSGDHSLEQAMSEFNLLAGNF